MNDNTTDSNRLEANEVDGLTRQIQQVCSQFEGPGQFADAMAEIDSLREQVVELESVIKTALEFLKISDKKGNEPASAKQLLHTMRWTMAYLESDYEKMHELMQVDLDTLGFYG